MKFNTDLTIIPIWLWLILSILLLCQGLYVFNDASKRGMNRWLWGLFCMLNTPTNLIIYLIVSRAVLKQKQCASCQEKYSQSFAYCPHCGQRADGD